LEDAEAALAVTRQLANPYVVQFAMAGAAFGLGHSDPERAYDLALEIVELDPRRRQSLPLAIAGDLAARNGEDREALELCIAAAKIMQWQNVRWGLGAILMRIGTILVACDPEAAAVLDGAGEALAPGFVHAPHTIEARERAVAMSTDALGEARRAELFQLGHAMTDIEAVAYAAAVVNRFLSEQ